KGEIRMSEQMKKTKTINGIPYILNEDDMKYYPTVTEDKEKGLTYTLDPKTFVYYPNLSVTEDTRDIGRFGHKRKQYLKENKPILYMQMFDDHSLTDHLIEVNESAEKQMEMLQEQMMKSEGVTEELKAQDQMKWVRMMNSIRARAEEIVLNNLIYA
ncbi:MAG: TnpV protein, partial [Clostridia bacterium]|nr:TnpV protein [Clostridia bacterium]